MLGLFNLATTSLNINFSVNNLIQYAQMIIDALMPVLYVTLGISLGFIVIRALKNAFN